ncbi:MAG: Flp pilus assembly protein CpaB [Anaerolineae bacterium]|nr:Flp pilus assembly protein CpaB [Anaerolineae bacterium]
MGRLRGLLWLTAGLVVAVLAGFVAFISLTRATAQRTGQEVVQPRVKVVVAARALAVRSLLSAGDLQLKDIPVDSVPEGAIREVEQAAGRLTLVDLYPGEVVLAQRLLDPNVTSADGRLALVVAADEVLMAIPAQDLMSRVGVLKPGDHVDLLFSLEFPANRGTQVTTPSEAGGTTSGTVVIREKEQATFNLLQNVTISAIVAGRTPTGGDTRAPDALLLAVSAQDALVLKYVKDAGGIMDVVLRAPGMERPLPAEPVDVDYLINRYQIPTKVGP